VSRISERRRKGLAIILDRVHERFPHALWQVIDEGAKGSTWSDVAALSKIPGNGASSPEAAIRRRLTVAGDSHRAGLPWLAWQRPASFSGIERQASSAQLEQ